MPHVKFLGSLVVSKISSRHLAISQLAAPSASIKCSDVTSSKPAALFRFSVFMASDTSSVVISWTVLYESRLASYLLQVTSVTPVTICPHARSKSSCSKGFHFSGSFSSLKNMADGLTRFLGAGLPNGLSLHIG